MADQRSVTALQPFVLLSKSATGRAAADLVVQATQAPGCYVFSELLETPTIQDLATSPDGSKYFDLLKIFAYGSYSDYKDNASNLPPLNPKQLEKLKQLSLITIASRGQKYLIYTSLLAELDLSTIRSLEDLVISAIYASLLSAKLDTKSQRVEVSSTAGRDVAPEEIPRMIETLSNWCKVCEDTLADIDEQAKTIQREAIAKKREADAYEKLLNARREVLKGDDKASGGKGKRVISEGADDGGAHRGGWGDDDEMDLDDSPFGSDGTAWGGANTSRRRPKNRLGGILSNKRR